MVCHFLQLVVTVAVLVGAYFMVVDFNKPLKEPRREASAHEMALIRKTLTKKFRGPSKIEEIVSKILLTIA